jgi:hypothetical protein
VEDAAAGRIAGAAAERAVPQPALPELEPLLSESDDDSDEDENDSDSEEDDVSRLTSTSSLST